MSELLVPSDGVYGVQYYVAGRQTWGIAIAIGTQAEANMFAATVTDGDVRVVRSFGGKWVPVAGTERSVRRPPSIAGRGKAVDASTLRTRLGVRGLTEAALK